MRDIEYTINTPQH